jgi:phytoene synthase
MRSFEDLAEAYRFCDRLAQKRARNFYPAFRFLPQKRRLALSAFYAFCTLSDDISDDADRLPPADRLRRLEQWKLSLERCFSGRYDSPVFLALADSIREFDLPSQPFYDLLDGIEMDLLPRCYHTFEDLELYCRRVAASVGRVSVRIFGCSSPGADEYADRLGIALQLTNILRDVGEDLHRDRLYLPLEEMERFGYDEKDLKNRVYDDRFRALVKYQYTRAVGYFNSADPALAGRNFRRLFPAEIMKAVYRRVLEEIHRLDFRIFDRRITLSAGKKAFAVLRACLAQI